MPVFLAAFGGMLLNLAGSLVGRVLVSLGVGLVAYSGLSTSLTWLKNMAVASAMGLPPEVLGMMSVLRVGSSISIIFSAILARLVINGLSGDTFKRWVTK